MPALRHAVQRGEAIHLLELRSGSQGHPAYRRVVLEMHRQIAEQAGHRVAAEAMNHSDDGGPGWSASQPSGEPNRAAARA